MGRKKLDKARHRLFRMFFGVAWSSEMKTSNFCRKTLAEAHHRFFASLSAWLGTAEGRQAQNARDPPGGREAPARRAIYGVSLPLSRETCAAGAD